MDPELQRLVERAEREEMADAEIAVIVKVSDLNAWQGRSEIRHVATLGATDQGDQLVTARVRVADLAQVRQWPEVLSLKPGRRVRPQLKAVIEDVNARFDLLPTGAVGNQGEGTVVLLTMVATLLIRISETIRVRQE